MLHACIKGKTKLPDLRYRFNGKVSGEKRTTCEDEIVSTVFGTLEFLPSQKVGGIIHSMISNTSNKRGREITIPGWLANDTIRHELRFWERMGNVEPDLLINLWNAQGKVYKVLMEAKWNSPLSENQLPKQAQQIQVNLHSEDESWIHVFIGKDLVMQPDQVHDNLIALTWLEFGEFLPDHGNDKYALLCKSFLQSSGVRRFNGFSKLLSIPKSHTNQEVLFWKGWDGWSDDLKILLMSHLKEISWSLALD